MTRRIVPIFTALLLTTSGIAAAAGIYASTPLQETTNATAATPVASLPPHPRLLLNKQGIVELKERIETAPWARSEWASLKTAADKTLNDPVNLPPRGGNWSHNYVCPIHGTRLKLGKQIGPRQWEHICPTGPHILKGDPSKATLDFDGNAISAAHGERISEATNDGLLFQVTGDAKYASKARAILLAYAEKYRTYPPRDNQGKPKIGGRVATQALTEASWLMGALQASDLVWATMSPAEQKQMADGLFYPALYEVIDPTIAPDTKATKRRGSIHNIQNYVNAAIGLTGFLLDDKRLINLAIDDPNIGYRQQMEKGVLADGMWEEGASGYHFFTIGGVWPLTEAARNCGIDLYGPKLKSMFDAPFTFAMPNLTLPDFNDSEEVRLKSRAEIYELGYARYKNPLYTALLTENRDSRLALLFGAPKLPKPSGAVGVNGDRNSAASGYAILQSGAGSQATWLCLKYGPHGGGHGHPDKNHFILYSKGEIVAPDGGVHAYGSPLHGGWDKATVAHNTLVVDQKSQSPAEGKSLAFGSEQGISYTINDAGNIYPSVRFVRTAAMIGPNLVVFLDQVKADAPHTFDIAYHQIGTWNSGMLAGTSWAAPNVNGYKFLKEATLRSGVTEATSLQTMGAAGKGVSAAITIAGGEPTDIITGYGLRKSTEDRVPMLIQRRQATQTAFLWAVSLDGTPVTLRLSPVKDGSGKALATNEAALIQVSSGKQTRLLLVNPDRRAVQASLPTGDMWKTEQPLAVRYEGK
jgi:hypothetical protein